MLNKITKVIGIGVIIGVSKLVIHANRIEIKTENGPIFVAEGIDGIELPEELSDRNHVLWDEYDDKFDYVGIKLNLPEELAKDCEDKYWRIYDKTVLRDLEDIVATEENFHIWCNEQKTFRYTNYELICRYAFLIKIANQKKYVLPLDFCKKTKIGLVLDEIHLKGAIRCMPIYTTCGEKYIRSCIYNIPPNSVF